VGLPSAEAFPTLHFSSELVIARPQPRRLDLNPLSSIPLTARARDTHSSKQMSSCSTTDIGNSMSNNRPIVKLYGVPEELSKEMLARFVIDNGCARPLETINLGSGERKLVMATRFEALQAVRTLDGKLFPGQSENNRSQDMKEHVHKRKQPLEVTRRRSIETNKRRRVECRSENGSEKRETTNDNAIIRAEWHCPQYNEVKNVIQTLDSDESESGDDSDDSCKIESRSSTSSAELDSLSRLQPLGLYFWIKMKKHGSAEKRSKMLKYFLQIRQIPNQIQGLICEYAKDSVDTFLYHYANDSLVSSEYITIPVTLTLKDFISLTGGYDADRSRRNAAQQHWAASDIYFINGVVHEQFSKNKANYLNGSPYTKSDDDLTVIVQNSFSRFIRKGFHRPIDNNKPVLLNMNSQHSGIAIRKPSHEFRFPEPNACYYQTLYPLSS